MRVIKFRGKSIDSEQWVYGDLLQFFLNGELVKTNISILPFEYIKTNETTYETKPINVLHDSIGQFTGRLDRNNKEVYEGDIVVIYYQNDKSCIGRVIFCDMAFCVKTKENVIFNSEDYYGIEIIGNIYDTPEFLK